MNSESDMERILKRIALITGLLVLAISVFFSYDGFDQSVSGSNDGYTALATVIGIVLAVVFTVIEFIFGTNFAELNWTLRGIGLFAYTYSIYTNYLGIQHILGADQFMAWSLAMIIDVYPEPAISWALGQSLIGDMVGNIGKMIFGAGKSRQPVRNFSNRPDVQSFMNQHRVNNNQKQGKHGKPNRQENQREVPFPIFQVDDE